MLGRNDGRVIVMPYSSFTTHMDAYEVQHQSFGLATVAGCSNPTCSCTAIADPAPHMCVEGSLSIVGHASHGVKVVRICCCCYCYFRQYLGIHTT
jgi:hypothetical protein